MPKILPFARLLTGRSQAAAPFGRRLRASAALVEDVADFLVRSAAFVACMGAMLAVTGAGLRLLS